MTTPAPSLSETLELLNRNQLALAAAVEELALWASQSGSADTHRNVHGALATLDRNAETIAAGIRAAASVG